MENQAQQNQTQPKQKQNSLSVKKILKLVFLGNGKYWPTAVFFWMCIIFLLMGHLQYDGYDNSFVVGVFLTTGVPIMILQFILSLPLQNEKLYYQLGKIGLTQDRSGFLSFPAFNIYITIISWFVIIFLINLTVVKLIRKTQAKKKPD